MFERVLVAIGLKRSRTASSPAQVPATAKNESDRVLARASAFAAPTKATPRFYARQGSVPLIVRQEAAARRISGRQAANGPAPSQDDGNDLVEAVLWHSLLHPSTQASDPNSHDCHREPEPFGSGRGGDFGGGGATGSWEPMEPNPSHDSVGSSSDDSGKNDSCSDNSSSSSISGD